MTTYRDWRQQRKCGQKIQYSGKNVASTAAVALAWIGRHNLEPYGMRLLPTLAPRTPAQGDLMFELTQQDIQLSNPYWRPPTPDTARYPSSLPRPVRNYPQTGFVWSSLLTHIAWDAA